MNTEDIARCLEELQSADPDKRIEALNALHNLETPLEVPISIDLIVSDPDPEVRAEAAFLLRSLSEAGTAGPPLLQALDDEYRMVRSNAAETVGYLHYTPAIGRLRTLLHTDAYWFVRAAAAEALGRLKDEASIPDLQQAIGDQNVKVQRAVVIALGQFIASPDLAPCVEKNLAQEQVDPVVRAELLSISYRLGHQAHLHDLLELLQQIDDYEQVSEILTVLVELIEEKPVPDLKNHQAAIEAALQKFQLKHPYFRSDVKRIQKNLALDQP